MYLSPSCPDFKCSHPSYPVHCVILQWLPLETNMASPPMILLPSLRASYSYYWYYSGHYITCFPTSQTYTYYMYICISCLLCMLQLQLHTSCIACRMVCRPVSLSCQQEVSLLLSTWLPAVAGIMHCMQGCVLFLNEQWASQ